MIGNFQQHIGNMQHIGNSNVLCSHTLEIANILIKQEDMDFQGNPLFKGLRFAVEQFLFSPRIPLC